MNCRNRYSKAYFSWRPWGYKLKILTSAWNLGGSVTPRYKSYPVRKSTFSFRNVIREQGLFKNRVAQNRIAAEKWQKILDLIREKN